jgi:hypothetical protein
MPKAWIGSMGRPGFSAGLFERIQRRPNDLWRERWLSETDTGCVENGIRDGGSTGYR